MITLRPWGGSLLKRKTAWQLWRHFWTCAFDKNSLATLALLLRMRVRQKQSGNLGGVRVRVRQKQSGNLDGTFAHARLTKTVWQPWRHFCACAFDKNSLATLAALLRMRVWQKQSGNLGGTFHVFGAPLDVFG